MKRPHHALKEFLRNKFGDSIAEFGPALFIVLMFLFFPMLNLISMGVYYGLGMVLNYNQVHEAALLPAAEANSNTGPVKKSIPEQWQAGMGQFAKLNGKPETNITYRTGMSGPGGGAGQNETTDKIVMVQTTIKCNPFLPIPLPIANIPGVNGPFTFTLASEALMENPDYAGSAVAIADDDDKLTVGSLTRPTVGASDDDTKPPIAPITGRGGLGWPGGLGGCSAR
jgi:hypothetical protein